MKSWKSKKEKEKKKRLTQHGDGGFRKMTEARVCARNRFKWKDSGMAVSQRRGEVTSFLGEGWRSITVSPNRIH